MAQINETSNFEKKLWATADKLRNNMDAAEYKHVVLGLIFLKYISDSFEEKHKKLSMRVREKPESYADPEDEDEYTVEGVFFVPEKARWSYIQSHAKQPEIGKIIDEAMEEIENKNPKLKGILQKNYARETLNKRSLGELIDLISSIGLGDYESKAKDVLGRVYEYFLGQFADAEGKRGGQFYTPACIVKTLVKMIEPYNGRIYDPCCGSGGMFIQSEKFVEEHKGLVDNLSIYGQESNSTTWKLANMNLAIRGIEADIKLGDSFHNDGHPDLRADFILANPPFNISDWGAEHLQEDARFKYGMPPKGNANYAWIQHMIYHLSRKGVAGFVLANGSMSSNTSGEGEIRKKLLEAGLVDAIVALPSQLFYNTMIPACLWFIRQKKEKRVKETLFIDARNMGYMINRKNKNLSDENINKISETYHKWQKGEDVDELGFVKSATLEDIEKQGFVLTPGRYVGVPEEEDDGIPFEEKMKGLVKDYRDSVKEGTILDREIEKNLKGLGDWQ